MLARTLTQQVPPRIPLVLQELLPTQETRIHLDITREHTLILQQQSVLLWRHILQATSGQHLRITQLLLLHTQVEQEELLILVLREIRVKLVES
jgi:hypothetical protein